ncbi:MAG: hypothetical protein LBB38_03760, partial [Puniceicoccales bacterium]|nr:hypothetical protein [Puniceicoccales bacterium]
MVDRSANLTSRLVRLADEILNSEAKLAGAAAKKLSDEPTSIGESFYGFGAMHRRSVAEIFANRAKIDLESIPTLWRYIALPFVVIGVAVARRVTRARDVMAVVQLVTGKAGDGWVGDLSAIVASKIADLVAKLNEATADTYGAVEKFLAALGIENTTFPVVVVGLAGHACHDVAELLTSNVISGLLDGGAILRIQLPTQRAQVIWHRTQEALGVDSSPGDQAGTVENFKRSLEAAFGLADSGVELVLSDCTPDAAAAALRCFSVL